MSDNVVCEEIPTIVLQDWEQYQGKRDEQENETYRRHWGERS